ncbi:hypothetical protein [Pseudomonas sp. Seg1]|uniref:hypothetical protein n=1 Tax=Pseudomonas sp. Seg1 TaxID=2678259 RepID=UPI001BB3F323|nr:hypothetical protein [Pseudomonas sp. Seg1]
MEEIRKSLYAAEGKGARKRVMALADDYDRLTLSHEIFPEKCLNFIIEILSTDAFFNKPGADFFIIKISSDMNRLSAIQKQALLDAIRSNYSRYAVMEFCWTVGDMLARHFDRTSVIRVFKSVFDQATAEGKEGIALGLDIIARHSKQDPGVMRQIQRILYSKPAH